MTTTTHHRLTRTAAGALAATALLAPAASAHLPFDEQQPTVAYHAMPAPDQIDSGQIGGTPRRIAAEQPAPTVTQTIDDGFDWGAAAIGAGGASVVLLLTAAGASAVGHRRAVT